MWKRNALIAAGNLLAETDDDELRALIERLARDTEESELVRATASAVLERIRSAHQD